MVEGLFSLHPNTYHERVSPTILGRAFSGPLS